MKIFVALLLALLLVATTAVPAAAATGWKVAVLIYRSINTTCNGRVVQGSLQQVEHDPVALTANFHSTIDSWSGVDHSVTVFEMGTLRDVTWTGSYCWPTPSDVPLPAGFDSYVVLYDSDADDPAAGVNSLGGLAYNGLVSNRFTYATVPVMDGDEWWFPNNTVPSLTMVHEWLHGVAGYYRVKYGVAQVPGVHDEAQFGYTDQVAWHRDLTSGTINGSIGIAPWIWDDGPPGTVTATPPPPTPSPEPSEPAPQPSDKACKNPSSNAKACR